MNSKIGKFIKNFGYVISSNLLNMLVSAFAVLIFPKFIGITEYGYWGLYLFYGGYIGFFHLGWVDGIYLKFGGKRYADLDKRYFYSQNILFAIYLAIVSLLVFLVSMLVLEDPNRRFIMGMISLNVFVVNLRVMIVYLLQCTNKLQEASFILILDRFVYVLSLLAILVSGSRSYQLMVGADILAKSVSLFYGMWLCRDLFFRPLSDFSNPLREVADNIFVGVNLLFSNLASMLIIGIIRFSIEHQWSIETFAKVSLTLSVSGLMVTFINAVGVVIFPLLRRTDPDNLPKIYDHLRSILMPVLFLALLMYYPLRLVLNAWLPAYRESLVFMALVFPMSVYEGKMALLINTYLKALRMEKTILKVNLITVAMSAILAGVTVYGLHNLELAVISIVLLLAFRCMLAEMALQNRLGLPLVKEMILELGISLLFILSNRFLGLGGAFLVYLATYALYLFTKVGSIKAAFAFLKNI